MIEYNKKYMLAYNERTHINHFGSGFNTLSFWDEESIYYENSAVKKYYFEYKGKKYFSTKSEEYLSRILNVIDKCKNHLMVEVNDYGDHIDLGYYHLSKQGDTLINCKKSDRDYKLYEYECELEKCGYVIKVYSKWLLEHDEEKMNKIKIIDKQIKELQNTRSDLIDSMYIDKRNEADTSNKLYGYKNDISIKIL